LRARPRSRRRARHTLTTDGICLSYVLADCAQPVAAWRGSAGSEKARGGVLHIVVAFCDHSVPAGQARLGCPETLSRARVDRLPSRGWWAEVRVDWRHRGRAFGPSYCQCRASDPCPS
jgi:hypothetical protein